MSKVEIISVSEEARLITVRYMPQSQRELVDALCDYWRDNEVDFSITEVLRYEKPQRIFFAVRWMEGEME